MRSVPCERRVIPKSGAADSHRPFFLPVEKHPGLNINIRVILYGFFFFDDLTKELIYIPFM